MMAAKGAIYPVFELMRDQSEPFSPEAYLPAVTGYYSDVAGNMLSFPFNVSTPILYYNKDLFRAAGLDPEVPPKTWAEVGTAAKRLRAAARPAGSPHPGLPGFMSRIFPRSTICRGDPGQWLRGLDAELTFNNPDVVRHIAQLAEWQATKVFDYSGRGQSAEPRFQKGECAIFIGSSGRARTSRPIPSSRSATA
jgi:sn-glycerol 3-phosphate transport system substrate-binding protein